MPQLDPTPWFPILIFSWLMFVTLVPPKIMKHTFINDFTYNAKKPETMPWNWPWH